MERRDYNRLYGPTTGDRVRLGDTNLFARIERDDTLHGFEPVTGFGRPMRDGMLIGRTTPSQLDMVVLNATVIDPVLGIFKSNIGIKDGRIVGIGRAGNPDVTDNIDLVVGPGTGMIPAEGLIATAGAIDSHVHLSSTSLAAAALYGRATTLIRQGSGAVWG